MPHMNSAVRKPCARVYKVLHYIVFHAGFFKSLKNWFLWRSIVESHGFSWNIFNKIYKTCSRTEVLLCHIVHQDFLINFGKPVSLEKYCGITLVLYEEFLTDIWKAGFSGRILSQQIIFSMIKDTSCGKLGIRCTICEVNVNVASDWWCDEGQFLWPAQYQWYHLWGKFQCCKWLW